MQNKEFTETTGSALLDLGFSEGEAFEIRVRAAVHRELMDFISEQQISRKALAKGLILPPERVNQLLEGRLSTFDIAELIEFAKMLALCL